MLAYELMNYNIISIKSDYYNLDALSPCEACEDGGGGGGVRGGGAATFSTIYYTICTTATAGPFKDHSMSSLYIDRHSYEK